MVRVKANSYMAKITSWGYIIIGLIFTPVLIGIPILIVGFINLANRERVLSKGRERFKQRENQVRSSFNIGVKYFQTGKYSLAIDEFNCLLKENDITSELKGVIYGLLARSYYLKQNWQGAVSASYHQFKENAIAGKKPTCEDYLVRAECLIQVNDLKQAKNILKTAKGKFNNRNEITILENRVDQMETIVKTKWENISQY